MLTRADAQALTEKILKLSAFPECTASVNESEQAFVRFANNGVTTSAFTLERTVTVQSTRENKTGITQTTDLSDGALRAAVKRSEELSAIAPPNPERVPPLGPQEYPDWENWDEATATARSPQMAPHVKAVIDAASGKKLIAAGFFNRVTAVDAFGSKTGNFGYSRSADCRFTTTVRTPDGSSSGWAGHPSVRISGISGAAIGARAIDKCLRWRGPEKMEPGKYSVVLEPTAVGDLLQLLSFSLQARQADEGQSVFSRKGGGTVVGEKFFPDFITLRTDPLDSRYPGQIWSQGNLPNRAVTWIEKGVIRNLAYDRYWALKAGKEPTPSPTALVLEGDSGTTEDLIKTTSRGLLVTRFWYIRSVNPQTLQLTGLTRDGLFLIEDGVVTRPVVNLRFNDSPVRLLQNAKRLGRNERVRGAEGFGMIAPSIQAADFTFTSISDAV